jgi:small subunit ribosomal protein S16
MLAIRLARIGTKNNPFYRLILCEKGRDNFGRNLEILGTYDSKKKDLNVDAEKIKAWIAKGAQLSPTLNNLFIDKKIIDAKTKKMKTRRSNTEKLVKKRDEDKKKAADAKAAEEAAKKAAEEAAKAEAEAAKAAAAAPAAEEPKAAEAPVETPVA